MAKNLNRKQITYFILPPIILSVISFLFSSEDVLFVVRVLAIIYFSVIFWYIRKLIKIQNDLIKQSNGYIRPLFDPNILLLSLGIFIVGSIVYLILWQTGLNVIDWYLVFSIGVMMVPFTLGLIPLRAKDNRWRK